MNEIERLTEQEINDLKLQLENNESFQYYKENEGLLFEHFNIIDEETNEMLKQSQDNKNYLYVKDGLIKKAIYCFE